uniref:Uncharacterized protein n=1 Tax=Leersia perrieri TaxID=77586 RepID=A0A0D9W0M4_9ORYZ
MSPNRIVAAADDLHTPFCRILLQSTSRRSPWIFTPAGHRHRRLPLPAIAAGALAIPGFRVDTIRIASASPSFHLLKSTASAPPIAVAAAVFAGDAHCPASPARERGKTEEKNQRRLLSKSFVIKGSMI